MVIEGEDRGSEANFYSLRYIPDAANYIRKSVPRYYCKVRDI